MPRIKLEMPDQYIYSTTIGVRVSDINYGNHLGNDALVSILHEARIRFLHNLHYSELDVEGIGIIMSDLIVTYKSQVYHAENLRIDIAVTDFTKKTCDFYYKVSKSDQTVVAFAKTTITFFDYNLQKAVGVPEHFKNRIKQATVV
jgi:acyl-CoA thioesterase FadM